MGLSVDGFFDIETENWTTFVLGGFERSDGTYFETRDEDELYDELVAHGGDVWAWNGGLYDVLWFARIAHRRRHRIRASCAGPRVTRCDRGSLRLRDALAVVPMGLSKAASIANARCPKDTGLPCRCGRDCGGYCAISRRMPRAHWSRLSEYLRHDIRVGRRVLQTWMEYADAAGWTLTGTIGGSAWATAKNTLLLPDAKWRKSGHYHTARRGYYGGRVQVFRPASPDGHRYDIHSAYPAALAKVRLPCGAYKQMGRKRAARAYDAGYEGIYGASVFVPDMHVPPLPWRYGDRVYYPVGDVIGHWTGLELRYAESLGARVRISSATVWERSEAIIAPLMRDIWKHRERAGSDTAMGKLLKLFANSLTGKFAQGPELYKVEICPPVDKIKACPADYDCYGWCQPKSRCCKHYCSARCKRWRALGLSGDAWGVPIWRIADCGHVQWAAYLTAATRIELHTQLVADGAGGRTAIYCDTDSVYSTTERTRRLGPRLGQWGYDGAMTEWIAIGPKLYRFRKPDGTWKVRAKGLPNLSAEEFERFADGHTVERSRGVRPLRSAIRAGELFGRKLLRRSNRSDGFHVGDRLLSEQGLTVPRSCYDIIHGDRERAKAESQSCESNPAEAAAGPIESDGR